MIRSQILGMVGYIERIGADWHHVLQAVGEKRAKGCSILRREKKILKRNYRSYEIRKIIFLKIR